MKKNTRIAVIAHDGKKADMVAFIMKRLMLWRQVQLENILNTQDLM